MVWFRPRVFLTQDPLSSCSQECPEKRASTNEASSFYLRLFSAQISP